MFSAVQFLLCCHECKKKTLESTAAVGFISKRIITRHQRKYRRVETALLHDIIDEDPPLIELMMYYSFGLLLLCVSGMSCASALQTGAGHGLTLSRRGGPGTGASRGDHRTGSSYDIVLGRSSYDIRAPLDDSSPRSGTGSEPRCFLPLPQELVFEPAHSGSKGSSPTSRPRSRSILSTETEDQDAMTASSESATPTPVSTNPQPDEDELRSALKPIALELIWDFSDAVMGGPPLPTEEEELARKDRNTTLRSYARRRVIRAHRRDILVALFVSVIELLSKKDIDDVLQAALSSSGNLKGGERRCAIYPGNLEGESAPVGTWSRSETPTSSYSTPRKRKSSAFDGKIYFEHHSINLLEENLCK